MKKIEKFENLMKISRDIEFLVLKNKISYMDAVLLYSEEKSIDIEHLGIMIANNSYIRQQIEIEAKSLNSLKGNK